MKGKGKEAGCLREEGSARRVRGARMAGKACKKKKKACGSAGLVVCRP